MESSDIFRKNSFSMNQSFETEPPILLLKAKFSKKKFSRPLDYWSEHNPILMAEEILYESRSAGTGKLQFIFSCIGYSLGLGNTWRFPVNCLKNGGGSFVFAYFIMTCLVGLPMILIELCLSQFTSKGATECWNFAPGFKGIGYSIIVINLLCCLCYTVILGWILFYFISTLQTRIPFLTCDNQWNDEKCIESGLRYCNKSPYESSSEEFWFRFVTTRVSNDGKSLNEIGNNPYMLIWYTSSCVIIAWMLSAFIYIKGIKIFEKWYAVSLISPYLVMISIIILGLQLPGSFQGFLYFWLPSKTFLFSLQTWSHALEQVFYSLGISLGGMLTIGSHSLFHRTIQIYVFFICFINMITAILHGMSLFLVVGFMVQKYSLDFSKISDISGNGIMFYIYPECFGNFKYPNLISSIFYLMVFVVGIDNMYIIMETVIGGFVNIFPVIEETKYHKFCFVLLLHILCATFSMIFVTRTGYGWFRIFEKYSFSINLTVVAFFETLVVAYIYKVKNFSRDYKMMVYKDLPFTWKIVLHVPTPIIFMILIFSLVVTQRTTSGYSHSFTVYPIWADVVGWMILVATILPIPFFFGYATIRNVVVHKYTLKKSFHQITIPNLKWGPMKKRNWLIDTFYYERLIKLKEETDRYKLEADSSKQNIVRPKWFPKFRILLSEDLFDVRKSKQLSSVSSVLNV